MTDVLRRYPDAAEACVETIAAIPEDVRDTSTTACPPGLPRIHSFVGLFPFGITACLHVCMSACLHVCMCLNVPVVLAALLQSIVEPSARAAYLWVLGEYGARIQVRCPRHAASQTGSSGSGASACWSCPHPLPQPAHCTAAGSHTLLRSLFPPSLPCCMPYPALLQDAPYVLEGFSDSFAGEAPAVKVALLTAALKLFFKRPPECRQGCPG